MDQKNTDKQQIVILTAEIAEFEKCQEYFPEFKCIRMGVGAGNVIKICRDLLPGTKIISVGYAGSNNLPIGVVTQVSKTYRLVDDTYVFVDYANGIELSEEGYPCYTNNSFVTTTEIEESVLFDMELNYIAAFVPRINLLGSVKIVSDNLSVSVYENNAIREGGVLLSDEVWLEVRDEVMKIVEKSSL